MREANIPSFNFKLLTFFFFLMSYVNAPIHDLLIRIKNAKMARNVVLEGGIYSRFKSDILELLKKYKFINNFEVKKDGNKQTITIHLDVVRDPVNDIPVIKFFSTPSRRWYVSHKDIKPVAAGRGIGIISTNEGVLPTHVARQKKIGGELIAEIY